MNEKLKFINGTIIFDKGEIFSNATIYIRLEDTSLMDVPSKILIKQTMSNISYGKNTNENGIKFFIDIDKITFNSNNNYSIFVHVDVNNDGKLNSDDYVSFQNNPVLTQGHSNFVTIKVDKIV